MLEGTPYVGARFFWDTQWTKHYPELMEVWPPTTLTLNSQVKLIITGLLTELPASKKLAVVESVGVLAGIGRFPRAMPQMAVMWVSVPNTYMATPKLLPVIKIRGEIMQIR